MGIVLATLVVVSLAAVLGGALGLAAVIFRVEGDPLVDRIDAILPQTQCGQCGFPGCKAYAAAIAEGRAEINQCPPGGEAGVRALADLLGREFKPLAEADGEEPVKGIAYIDETLCIGCTLCIQACPVDAISGAAKQLHSIVPQLCTGCGLCLPPCPVECIHLEAQAAARPWPYPVFALKQEGV